MSFLSARHRLIFKIALPIMTAMVSQSLMNLIDTIMVGSLGSAALAGVGLGGYANFVAMSIVIGLGAGVQAMVARRKGEGDPSVFAVPLNAGLLTGTLLCLPILLAGWLLAHPVMTLLNSDPAVLKESVPYFIARLVGIFAIAMNFSFRGYWNGINHSHVYMRILVFTQVLNVAISYCLIFGALGFPELGATGAGIGTTLSLYIASILYFVETFQYGRKHGFLSQLPPKAVFINILKVSLPNSIQQLFFSAGLMVLFAIIGLVGTREQAVAHVLITIILFLILPAIGLGLASSSLVGQALGRGQPEEAYRWGWDIARIAMVMLFTLAIPMWFSPEIILGIFLHDPELIELGRVPLMITGMAIFLDGISIIFTQSLLGAGASRSVMFVTVSVQWFFFLPAAFIAGPTLGFGLLGIWCMQALHRFTTAVWLGSLWVRRGWTQIEL